LINARDGSARTLGPDLGQSASDLAWLPDGSGLLLALAKPWTEPSQIWELTNPGGKLVQLSHDLQGFDRVTIASQAGGALALVHSNPQYSVWRQAQPGGSFEQLPGGGANLDGQGSLAWTPQGQVVSVRNLAGLSQLWIEGGSAPAQQIPITNLPAVVQDLSVSRSGQIVFMGINPGGNWNAYQVALQGGNASDLTPGLNILHPALMDSDRTVAMLNVYETHNTAYQRLWAVPLAGGQPREIS